jgi:hypothetical protein
MKLAFLVSTPRSGSTLLGAMLAGHADVLCPAEPWVLLPLASLVRGEVFFSGAFDQGLTSQAVKELLPPDVLDRSIRAFVTEAYGSLCRRANKEIFVDKTPRYYQILPDLERIFPEARKIWIKRSPLDVLASLKDTWNVSIDELIGKTFTPFTFDATMSWRLLLDFFGPAGDNCLTVKYEDLVFEPDKVLLRLGDLLGVAFDDTSLAFAENEPLMDGYRRATMGDRKFLETNSVHARSIDRWREIFSANEVETILRTLGTGLFAELGYEAVLVEALEFSGVSSKDIPAKGRMEEITQAFQLFPSNSLRRFAVASREKPLSEQLQAVAEDRQALLLEQSEALIALRQQLDEKEKAILAAHEASIRQQSDLGEKEEAIIQLNKVAGERLALIENLEMDLSRLQIQLQELEAERQLQEEAAADRLKLLKQHHAP